MSLIQTFVDAFRKAAGKSNRPDVDLKSQGPMGSTDDGKAFDPLRPAPQAGDSPGIDRGDVAADAGPQVASGDPEEGGEAPRA